MGSCRARTRTAVSWAHSPPGRALHHLARAEHALGHRQQALAALRTGAANHAERFNAFEEEAQSLGAWRLPPPLGGLESSQDQPVRCIGLPSRAEWYAIAECGEPVIIRGFANIHPSQWSWEALADAVRSSDVRGPVIVSSTGVIPDYCRDAPNASTLETMHEHELALSELFARVVSSQPGAAPTHLQPLVAHFEALYAYGKSWMLQQPALRVRAAAARPAFLTDADVLGEGDGCVCWVGSAGCLTPLHYDMTDGLLAQVIGTKRVWLFSPEAAESLHFRSSRRPGLDNWERQSGASLHGAAAARFPSMQRARRYVAELSPGELLYIPSDWAHEVHTCSPSFSLGWRVAVNRASGPEEEGAGAPLRRTERTASQTLERLAGEVKSGKRTLEETLLEALADPKMREAMSNMLPGLGAAPMAGLR